MTEQQQQQQDSKSGRGGFYMISAPTPKSLLVQEMMDQWDKPTIRERYNPQNWTLGYFYGILNRRYDRGQDDDDDDDDDDTTPFL